MGFKNLPTEAPQPLSLLVEARDGQVTSRTITRVGDPLAGTVLAFSAGESVSEERYPGDTLYYLIEGTATVNGQDMRAGDVLVVPAGTNHAVDPRGPAKLLQLTLQ